MPDGSYSENIPLAVDGNAIDVNSEGAETNLNEYVSNNDNKVNKKIYYYNTVTDMKKDIKLKEGDSCQTLGYYEVNDGGESLYKIIPYNIFTDVTLNYDNEKQRYYFYGQSYQNGIPSVQNKIRFIDDYSKGKYKTNIDNVLYSFLLSENLKSIDNIADIFWIDVNNNKMGIEQYIKEIVLNGTEFWENIDNTAYSNTILRFRTTDIRDNLKIPGDKIYIASDRLPGVQLGQRTSNGIARQQQGDGINIFINKTLLPTANLQGFIEFLKENPLLVRYVLDAPIKKELNQINLDNGLLAIQLDAKQNNNTKSILDYANYCIDGDWLPAFEKAQEDKIKSLYLPAGIYPISDTFIINTSMHIYGDGRDNSCIYLMENDNRTGQAVIEFNAAHDSLIENCWIKSSKTGQTLLSGLYIHFSNYVSVKDLKVSDINGNGIYVYMSSTSNTSYDCVFSNVVCENCQENGFYLNATDLFITNCIARWVNKHGFYFTKSNSLIIGCKAYWTGQDGNEFTGDGFYMETSNYSSTLPTYLGHKTRLINCEAQECGRYGFTLINTDSCQLLGCQVDSCGQFCTNVVSYGYYLKNNRCLTLIGSVVNQNLTGWIKNPLYFNNGNNNYIQITAQLLKYGSEYYKYFDDLYKLINYNPSNQIYINNNNIAKNIYESELYEYDNTSGVANGWIGAYAGSSTTTQSMDFINRCQELNLQYTNGSAADDNVKIYKEFNVSGSNFNKIAMSVLAKSQNIYCIPMLRFRLYNGTTQTAMGTVNVVELHGDSADNDVMHWNTGVYMVDIPSNITKVRVELLGVLQQSGVTARTGGKVLFKDFKLFCYKEN